MVGASNRDAAVEPQVAEGKIQHLGTDGAELERVGARVRGSVGNRRGQRRARHPHAMPDCDPFRLELLDKGATDRVSALLVELRGVDGTDVVCLEHLWIEHRRDANGDAWLVTIGVGERASNGAPADTAAMADRGAA